MERYKTVLISDETELEIKRIPLYQSRFSYWAKAEAEAILAEIRKKQYKASCLLDLCAEHQSRASFADDSHEHLQAPPTTVLRSTLIIRDLKDVVVVVIRYFGGVFRLPAV